VRIKEMNQSTSNIWRKKKIEIENEIKIKKNNEIKNVNGK